MKDRFDFGMAWKLMHIGDKVTIDDKNYYTMVDGKLHNRFGEITMGVDINMLNSKEWHLYEEPNRKGIKWTKQDCWRMKLAFDMGYEFIARGSAKSGGFVSLFSRYPIQDSDGGWDNSLSGAEIECDIDWFKPVQFGECVAIEGILETIQSEVQND